MKDKHMNIIINILAGVGAFCLAATVWVIAVAIVFAWYHTRKQHTRAVATPGYQAISQQTNPPFGEITKAFIQDNPTWQVRHIQLDTIHPNRKTKAEMEAETIIEDLLK